MPEGPTGAINSMSLNRQSGVQPFWQNASICACLPRSTTSASSSELYPMIGTAAKQAYSRMAVADGTNARRHERLCRADARRPRADDHHARSRAHRVSPECVTTRMPASMRVEHARMRRPLSSRTQQS